VVTPAKTRTADSEEQPQLEARRACLFSLCGEILAIDVDRVYEVMQEATVTPLPQVPLGLAGMVNFRGEILPVIDLTPWFTNNTRPPGGIISAIIVQTGGTQFGLRIDAVSDVAEFRDLTAAKAEILRPGLENCLRPVAATSFHGRTASARRTIWYLSADQLLDRLTETFSTSRKDV
jgi:chemotaxis signal transduction protein